MVSSPTSQLPDEAKPSSDAPSQESLRRGYETTHISITALLAALVGLAIGAMILGVGVWYVEKSDLKAAARGDRSQSFIHIAPDLNGLPHLQPDGPAHDTTPPQDLAAMHQSEDAVFADMGWRDPRTGMVSVPAAISAQVIHRPTPTTRPAP